MFAHVSVWGVLLAALSAMVIGTIWYSKQAFGAVWMKATGLSDKDMQNRFGTAMPLLVIMSLLTAYVLSLFIVYFHAYVGGSWLMAGFDTAVWAWLGFAGTALWAHGVWEPKREKLLYVNIGNRLVTLVVMGLILGAFLK